MQRYHYLVVWPSLVLAKQWLPTGSTLTQATASLMSQECVWATARVKNYNWTMCLHPGHLDRHVSRVIQTAGCIECDDVAFALDTVGMSRPSAALFIDLGGNIGMYALAAAAVGHSVVTFEPMLTNAVRLLASARKNGFQSRLHLMSLCVSDEPGTRLCQLGLNPSNQGHLRHQIAKPPSLLGHAADSSKAGARGVVGPYGSGPLNRDFGFMNSVAVRVDDVLPPQRSRRVFIKVDLEGGECRAFRGMRRFINESTRIIGALVEFDKSRACCEELIASPDGAFYLLHHRHGLCPVPSGRGSGAASRAATNVRATMAPEELCKLSPGSVPMQLNVRFQPCLTPPHPTRPRV